MFQKLTRFGQPSWPVTYMETDLRETDAVLFSNYTAIMSTNDSAQSTVIGGSRSDYKEGDATEARFKRIYSFAQLNQSTIVVADSRSCCLRLVFRHPVHTSHLFGNSGACDSGKRLYMRPTFIKKHWSLNSTILVADDASLMNRRYIWIIDVDDKQSNQDSIQTYKRVYFEVGRRGLKISGLAWNIYGSGIFLCIGNFIGKLNETGRFEILAGDDEAGHMDGHLNNAMFEKPGSIMSLSGKYLLLVDGFKYRLRLVDIQNDLVRTVCDNVGIYEDYSMPRCGVNLPRSLLHHKGALLIGGWGRIGSIPSEFE